MGGIGVWQLLIVLAIVLLLFGTKRLRSVGGDMGSAIRSFRKAVKDEDDKTSSDASSDRIGQSRNDTDPASATNEADKKKENI